MAQVAFFLDNKRISKVDFSNPLSGNPGSGATEFMTVLVCFSLAMRKRDTVLLVTEPGIFPKTVKVILVDDVYAAIEWSEKQQAILVIRSYLNEMNKITSRIKLQGKVRIVIWAHLTPSPKDLRDMASVSQIVKIVCLENNQRVRIIDNKIHCKAVTIPYPVVGNTNKRDLTKLSYNIVYMGALVPQKGFHFLADVWPKINKKNPQARLIVLGSADLYDTHLLLGRNKIASEQYELRIFRNLDIHDPSVAFLGNVNVEARDAVLESALLGIVNPSGLTETFCSSAVEFQQRGIPVVGARKFGLLDTVLHRKTGYLVMHPHLLSSQILKLSKNKEKNYKLGDCARKTVMAKYKMETVLSRWENLIEHIATNQSMPLMPESRKVEIKSLQAVTGLLNRRFVNFFFPLWPTQVELWIKVKRLLKFLFSFKKY